MQPLRSPSAGNALARPRLPETRRRRAFRIDEDKPSTPSTLPTASGTRRPGRYACWTNGRGIPTRRTRPCLPYDRHELRAASDADPGRRRSSRAAGAGPTWSTPCVRPWTWLKSGYRTGSIDRRPTPVPPGPSLAVSSTRHRVAQIACKKTWRGSRKATGMGHEQVIATENLSAVFAARRGLRPSTFWKRIEGRPPNPCFERALRAEVRVRCGCSQGNGRWRFHGTCRIAIKPRAMSDTRLTSSGGGQYGE